MSKKNITEPIKVESSEEVSAICGIVMPISGTDGHPIYTEKHWQNVHDILVSTLNKIGFKASLVSYGEDAGILQKRIVQNLYHNEIIVCDISGRNPNVMLELGLRLAFQKPTIIINDTLLPYPFDVNPVEYVPYPADLNYYGVLKFQEDLSGKIRGTFEAWKKGNYSSFLSSFGEFEAPEIKNNELSSVAEVLTMMTNRLDSLQSEVRQLGSNQTVLTSSNRAFNDAVVYIDHSSPMGAAYNNITNYVQDPAGTNKGFVIYPRSKADSEATYFHFNPTANTNKNRIRFWKDIDPEGRRRPDDPDEKKDESDDDEAVVA